MEHYFEEEAHYYYTLNDLKDLVLMYGDRVWADLENYCPDLYEAFCAYEANKQVEEFLYSPKNTGCGEYND